uniref:Protein kinase domain-containing protein n=1 Tax=Chenopodium quinoa TaxID=63459 RepID=A0A803LCW0_CHEQI
MKSNLWVFYGVNLVFLFHLQLLLLPCSSLNSEGLALLKFKEKVVRDPFNALSNWSDKDGDLDHCSWFGVSCSEGNVVILNLKDLCLGGTLASELGNLYHIKSIILRNNSFDGIIASEIADLKELEMLDLGYNNFSGPIPSNLGNNFSLSILLLDNNNNLGSLSPELNQLQMQSEHQVDEEYLRTVSARASCNSKSFSWSWEITLFNYNLSLASLSDPPSPTPSNPPVVSVSPAAQAAQVPDNTKRSGSKQHKVIILASVAGGLTLLIISAAAIIVCRSSKIGTVKPWATGLSGQLQRAFVSGVPKLKRAELETACEDFSNIIGTLNDGTVYKGTLSSGIEIAVVATSVKSSEEWSRKLEAQFRKKIETLSKVNHKNFVNLIGFCEEEKPFTRMMVFEYAPNGTLFEHLHIKEAERLDWKMRLRVIMGMAYCLEHMHQLNPPIPHRDLQSSSMYLSEDYATKVSDFSFWTVGTVSKMRSPSMHLLEAALTDIEGNVYNFGMVLLEIITGRMPYMEDNRTVADWVFYCLEKDYLPQDIIDPTLSSFKAEEVQRLFWIIKDCVQPDPQERPTMKTIAARLREITGMGPDGATPRLSPLWWAELEVMSMDGS